MPVESRIRRPALALAACVAMLALAGCAAVGPEYRAPQLSANEVPAEWTTRSDRAAVASGEAMGRVAAPWWEELSDPLLDRLITQAFAGSPSLEAALAKLGQARSASGQAGAAARPTVDGGGAASASGSDGKRLNQTWLSVNSAWEIDLFGAVRRGKEGAAAREEAQIATLADARVSLAADVTDAYMSYRACQSHAALSEQDVLSREATAKLTDASVREGFMAPYQAIRSHASVAEAKTQQVASHAYCDRLENLLTRLTGMPRPALVRALESAPTGLARLPVPRHFDIAIPRDAVMLRPDIRAAERSLAAASADIGLAEADRYPRVSLNGDFGYAASRASGGSALSFGSWSFGPAVSLPIFDGGRRQAAVGIAQARYDEALAEFRARARRAIQEIEDGLTRYAAAHERTENARVSATQYQQFFDTVEVRFKEGASNLLELEDARRAMLGARQTYLNVQLERLQAWVALNRATGGGAQYAPAGDPSAPAGGHSARASDLSAPAGDPQLAAGDPQVAAGDPLSAPAGDHSVPAGEQSLPASDLSGARVLTRTAAAAAGSVE